MLQVSANRKSVGAGRPGGPLALALLLLCGAAGACSDAQLYRGADVVFQNDRVALSGRFCTVDPSQQRFPVKIVFLIDTSAIMQTIDPGDTFSRATYASMAVDEIVQRYVNSTLGNYTFAIIGYGGRPRLLSAGTMGETFTRRPDLLQNAVQVLRLPEPCQGSTCSDLPGGISLAASLISGDLLTIHKGEAARTRYVIINLLGGPPQPRIMKCQCDAKADPMCTIPDAACEQSAYLKQITDLAGQVRAAGAKELRFHASYLRDAAPTGMPRILTQAHEDTMTLLQRLSAAGNGAFECHTAPDLPECAKVYKAPDLDRCTRQNMLCPSGAVSFLGFGLESAQRPFLIKKLVVYNINTLATATGPLLDSDGDGLSDDEEAQLGTLPDVADTDNDGVTDLVEVRLGTDPRVKDPPPPACYGIDFSQLDQAPLPDSDGDLLNDCEERLLGTDPTLADTDGDGLPDGLELRAGTNYLLSDYLIPPYDHDGIPNGDEVRQHTAPRADDSMEALGYAYSYEEQNEGVKALPYASQPRDISGVSVLDVSPGSTPGAGTLRYTIGPPKCNQIFPAPRSMDDEARYQRCLACPTCPTLSWKDANDCDFGPEVFVDTDEVRRRGGLALTLGSKSASGGCGVKGMTAPMSDYHLVVRIENAAVLPRVNKQETIVIGTAMRACEKYQIRNVALKTPLPDRTKGREESQKGVNNIYVYFGQGPDGQLTAPGIYSTALVRVRYNPPARREPADPNILLQQQDFVVLGGN